MWDRKFSDLRFRQANPKSKTATAQMKTTCRAHLHPASTQSCQLCFRRLRASVRPLALRLLCTRQEFGGPTKAVAKWSNRADSQASRNKLFRKGSPERISVFDRLAV